MNIGAWQIGGKNIGAWERESAATGIVYNRVMNIISITLFLLFVII